MTNKHELRIGSVELNNPFLLAPMAGVTDAPMRRICARMGASLTYSEMISAKALYYGDKKTETLLETYADEGPLAIQIFGHEPDIIAFAAEKLDGRPNVILDINMGCPVPKVVKSGDGSALMKDPALCGALVRAAVQATSKPVTVKIRAGFTNASRNAVEVALACEAAGAAAVAVHGRTREQYYSGRADRTIIAEVKKALSIPVIGNGDITDVASARQMLEETGCDLLMVGRAAQGNPWIFRDLKDAWEGRAPQPAPGAAEKCALLREQMADLLALKGEYTAVRQIRKVTGWYLRGMPGSARLRGSLNTIETAAEWFEAIDRIAREAEERAALRQDGE